MKGWLRSKVAGSIAGPRPGPNGAGDYIGAARRFPGIHEPPRPRPATCHWPFTLWGSCAAQVPRAPSTARKHSNPKIP
jgi:Zn-dependent M28 family amino/carboxypeptidase